MQGKIIKMVDISYGGENGFNQAIELAAESLANVKFIQEKKLIGLTHLFVYITVSFKSIRKRSYKIFLKISFKHCPNHDYYSQYWLPITWFCCKLHSNGALWFVVTHFRWWINPSILTATERIEILLCTSFKPSSVSPWKIIVLTHYEANGLNLEASHTYVTHFFIFIKILYKMRCLYWKPCCWIT